MRFSAILETDAPQQMELAPLAPGSALRNAIQLYRNSLLMFLRWYQDPQLGAIYRFRAGRREYTVLAGREANLRLKERDGKDFLSYEIFQEAGRQLHQSGCFISELDGEPHQQVRKTMQPGFTPEAADSYVPRMAAGVEQVVRGWQVGQVLHMNAAMQELVSNGLGLAMVHHAIGNGYKDAVTFGSFLNGAAIAKTWPRPLLYHPGYLLAKWRMERRMDKLMKQRGTPNESERDLLDVVLGQPGLSTIDCRVAIQLPFMAGDDTAAPLIGCLLYELHTRPTILARVQAEVDAAYADGPLTAETLQYKLPTLWSVIWEAFRLHPVFSGVPRVASCAFTFAGRRVEAGQNLIFATPVTNFLPEFFPDPETFDIERARRGEFDRPDVFLPFATGPHICIGRFVSEKVIGVIVATILHEFRLELEPGYVLKTGLNPLLRLSERFHMRVVERRLTDTGRTGSR